MKSLFKSIGSSLRDGGMCLGILIEAGFVLLLALAGLLVCILLELL